MPGNSSSRQFSSASANKAASASSSPAMVFKNAGGLKARSMNSLQMQLREQAAAGRESREHRREQGATVVRGSWERLREQGAAAGRGSSTEHGFVQPTIHVFYNEGSELSEFRLGKKRTLPQVPPSPPPLPPLPLPPPPEMDFECECEIAEGDANYKSLTPSQFEEHVVKTLTDGNNNRSGSGKESDADEKYREGGTQEFDNGN